MIVSPVRHSLSHPRRLIENGHPAPEALLRIFGLDEGGEIMASKHKYPTVKQLEKGEGAKGAKGGAKGSGTDS